MKKLVVMLLLFFSAVGAQSADNQRDLSSQETFKILGIELGKDTIDDVKKIAHEKKCRLEKNEDESYSLEGCFDLPGEYWTRYSFDKKTGKVFSICFSLLSDGDRKLANESPILNYLEALENRYGKPSSVNHIPRISVWIWKFPNLKIDARDSFGDFYIEYTSLVVTRMMKEREVNRISSQM